MGIQINGNTDTISAIDGGLNVSGASLGSASASSLNISGIVTASGGFSGNVNSTGVSTFSGGIVVAAGSTSAPSISPTGDSNTGIFFPSPDTIAFTEGGVEILRVNSSGNIGIGTTDSLNKFEVGNVSGGVTAPDFTVSTVSLGSSVTIGRLSSVGSDNTFFRVRDRVNRTLLSAVVGGVDIGSTDVTTPLTIRNGNLVFSTAGTGIDFSATANSSGTMTSELLSDYEEGTWTPTLTFGGGSTGIAYSQRQGNYVKIGNRVIASAVVFLTSRGTSTGNNSISGLPFTVRQVGGGLNFIAPAALYGDRMSACHIFAPNDGTFFNITTRASGPAVTVVSLTHTDWSDTTYFAFTVSYRTDA